MKRFQEKTRAMFVKFTLIPIISLCLILGICLGGFVYYQAHNEINKSSQETLGKIEQLLKDYEGELTTLSKDKTIEKYIFTRQNPSEVLEKFYTFNVKQNVKSSFRIYDLKGKILSSAPSDDFFPIEVPYLIKKRMSNNPESISLESRFVKHLSLTLGKAVQNNQNEIIGYLLFSIDDTSLQDELMAFQTTTVVVTDNFDNILFTSENYLKDLLGKIKTRKTTKTTVMIDDVAYYQDISESDLYNIKIYSLIKRPPFSEYALFYLCFIFIIAIIMYYLIHFLAKRVAKTNSESIDALVSSLDNAKLGQLHELVDIRTGDEFEYLAKEYNEMLTQLNQVILNNEELTHIQQQNEIKFLQSQFNPHFLFNMLETIKYTMSQDVDKAKDIIIMLSKLLRYSVNQASYFATLEVDMEYVRAYLELHKYRYKDRLNFQINIEENLFQEEIPRLLIQPIVENSIKYGYLSQMVLTITIDVYAKNDIICFEVHDNGKGMAEETLFDIQKSLASDDGNKIGIGLILIHRKIKILHGPEYGLQLESSEEKGTTVLVTMPRGRNRNV